MPVLIWNHGKSKAEAVNTVRAAIEEAGHGGSVKWDGTRLEARAGPFGSVVHVECEVTDDAIVIERCGGLAGGRVLMRCREMLARLFPGGEQGPAHAPLPAIG